MQVHWHRDDLRAEDNPALASGDGDEDVRPVFVFDPAVLSRASGVRVSFLLDCILDLRREYRRRGSDLTVRHGSPEDVLVEIVEAGDTVTWNRGYTPLARRRQRAVEEVLESHGADHDASDGVVLHAPTEIYSQAGDPYSVFSYYQDSWLVLEKPEPVRASEEMLLEGETDVAVPTIDELGIEEPEADHQSGGLQEGVRRLREFCDGDVYRYAEDRDRPAADSTSRLSPHLRFGTVGPRQVWSATVGAHEAADSEAGRDGVEEFRRQLCFREFYTQLLYHHPETVTESYRTEPRWRSALEEVERWKQGETGYPLVDAGMRQLLEEAWMHNRARMVAASFLTKHLLVDWRVGIDWFRQRLVDHGAANDVAGWQWAASTGVDAQPYFRVFNPIAQCREHDPDGEYVRSYVPELRDLSAEEIHRLPEMDVDERREAAPDYPSPVVDHSDGRERVLEAFEEARDGE